MRAGEAFNFLMGLRLSARLEKMRLHQPLDSLFDGVFEEMPWHLREQQAQMLAEEAASGRPWARK